MKSLCLLVGLSLIGACESNERKLERLKATLAEACRPVFVADSTVAAHEQIFARMRAGLGTFADQQSDIDAAKRITAELQAKIDSAKSDPGRAAATAKADSISRTRCQLAQRSMNMFMAGR